MKQVIMQKEFIKEAAEVKKVYDVKLFKDDVEVQPDGYFKSKDTV